MTKKRLPDIINDTRRWINVGLTLVQRRRRWTNVKPTSIQRLVSAGMAIYVQPFFKGTGPG